MTFENPVVAGEQLVRNAIKSPNYVPGGTGWRIAHDGSAEFGDVVIRGTVSGSVAHADTADSATNATNAANGQSTVYDDTSGWSITADGNATFHNVTTSGYASGPTGTYDSLTANTSFMYKGDELQSLLDALPRGLQSSGVLTSGSASGITTEVGIGELSFTQVAGRDYKVTFNGLHWSCQTALATVQVSLRMTADGTAPTITSNLFDSVIVPAVNVNQALSVPPLMPMGTYSATDGALIRVLVTIQRLAGTGTISYNTYNGTNNYKPFRFYCEDVGLDVGADTWVPNTGGGGGGAPAPKTIYTSTWYSTGVQSYQSNGTVSTATNHNVYGYQGDGTAVGNPGGSTASTFFFNSAAIRSALAGATILHTYIYTKNVHTYYNSGATARVGTHGQDGTVGNVTGLINARRWNQTTAEGGTVWSGDVGPGLGQEFRDGTTHGMALGYCVPATLADYGYWSQMGIRVVYQK